MEKRLGLTEARREFSTIVERVQHEGDAYIVSRHCRPAAAVVPMYVYESWKRQRNEFFELVRRAQQRAGLESEEADQLAAEAVAAIRANIPPPE